MSKHRVAVLKVVSSQSSVAAAALECRISRQHLHRLLRRKGAITLRRAGRLYHLKIGATFAACA